MTKEKLEAMDDKKSKSNLHSYLDKLLDKDGIKTSNKIEISVDNETAVALLGIGIGLVIFSHLIGTGLKALMRKRTI